MEPKTWRIDPKNRVTYVPTCRGKLIILAQDFKTAMKMVEWRKMRPRYYLLLFKYLTRNFHVWREDR